MQDRSNDVMMKRKEAAKYINYSPGTLAVWHCKKTYDLKPFIVGKRSIRYWKSELDKFLVAKLEK